MLPYSPSDPLALTLIKVVRRTDSPRQQDIASFSIKRINEISAASIDDTNTNTAKTATLLMYHTYVAHA
jgi:ribosomal protein L11